MIGRSRSIFIVALAAILAVGACGSDESSSDSATSTPTSIPSQVVRASGLPPLAAVRVQLGWLPQAQFGGYFAADALGYYEATGIDVTFVAGGPDVAAQTVGSSPDGPEFTITWLPKVLEAREAGSDLVDIAQVFRRSGTLSLSWRDSGIARPADFADRRVGVRGNGDAHEITAAARQADLEPGTDYREIIQESGVEPLLSRTVDVAQAMIYDEYAQVLEATDPATRDLFQPTDLNVINYNDEGTAMPQDGVFAREAWLATPGNEDLTRAFLAASFRGWVYCRDDPDDCVGHTIEAVATVESGVPEGGADDEPEASDEATATDEAAATEDATDDAAAAEDATDQAAASDEAEGDASASAVPGLGVGHQTWMLNEVNPLIWPSPDGIGIMDPELWEHTVEIMRTARLLRADPSPDAYRTDLAQSALAELADLDTTGTSFVPGSVEVTPGGE